jgi:diguanylate cyclase (GGDEF)-like protein
MVAGIGAVAAAAGVGTGLRLRHRLRRVQAAVAGLHRDLQAERHAANHDPLTGLPNRRAFYQLGAELVTDPVRPAIACVVVDLNCFKQINDTLGHAAGDEVLVTVAGRLATYAGSDLVARLGGDEFAGLFTNPTTGWRLLYPAADDLAAVLAAPMWVAGRSLQINAAIGAAPVRRSIGLTNALHQADCAMYRAKTTGLGVACFTPALDDDTVVLPGIRSTASPPAGRDGAWVDGSLVHAGGTALLSRDHRPAGQPVEAAHRHGVRG